MTIFNINPNLKGNEMAKTSVSVEYGILAIGYIAKQQADSENMIQAWEIANYHKISEMYLLKILHQLVQGNVLRSKRGPRGGFCLARAASKISLLEVVVPINGPFRGYSCVTENAGKAGRRLEVVSETVAKLTVHALSKVKVSSLI